MVMQYTAARPLVLLIVGLNMCAFAGCGITIYGPNLNLVKDPRWGRGQEVMGEDPHLMSRLVVAWVSAI